MTDNEGSSNVGHTANTNFSKSSSDLEAPVSPSQPPTCSGAMPTSSSTPHTVNAVNPHGIDSIQNRRTGLTLPTSSLFNVGDNLSTYMSRLVDI